MGYNYFSISRFMIPGHTAAQLLHPHNRRKLCSPQICPQALHVKAGASRHSASVVKAIAFLPFTLASIASVVVALQS